MAPPKHKDNPLPHKSQKGSIALPRIRRNVPLRQLRFNEMAAEFRKQERELARMVKRIRNSL